VAERVLFAHAFGCLFLALPPPLPCFPPSLPSLSTLLSFSLSVLLSFPSRQTGTRKASHPALCNHSSNNRSRSDIATNDLACNTQSTSREQDRNDDWDKAGISLGKGWPSSSLISSGSLMQSDPLMSTSNRPWLPCTCFRRFVWADGLTGRASSDG